MQNKMIDFGCVQMYVLSVLVDFTGLVLKENEWNSASKQSNSYYYYYFSSWQELQQRNGSQKQG